MPTGTLLSSSTPPGLPHRYYVANYDNNVWAAAMLLAEATDDLEYHDIVRTFLRAWQGGKAPQVSSAQEKLQEFVAEQRKMSAQVGSRAARPAVCTGLLGWPLLSVHVCALMT
jgi:hypothetical protein